MSTLKVSKIEPVTTGGDCIVNATNIVGNKNLVINGAMQVAQRGTSSTSSGFYTLDRFQLLFSGHNEALTQAQHALTSSDTGPWEKGFRSSWHIQNGNQTSGAGATDYIQCEHRLEAQDVANSGWDYTSSSSYITLSFWIKSSVAQAFPFTLNTSDGTTYRLSFDTGNLSANTWTKVTQKIAGNANLTFNNDTGVGLYIYFWPYMGTTWTGSMTENTWIATSGNSIHCNNITSTWWTTNDATLEVTGLQLEVGDTATDYEHRSYGDELARSQRYYQGFTAEFREDDSSDGSIFFGTLGLPVKMRSAPTITSSYASSYNVNTGASLEDSHIDSQAICFGHRSSGAGTRARRTIGLSSEL